MLKHTWSKTIRTDAGSGISDAFVHEGVFEENINITVAATDNEEIDLTVDVSKIVSFFVELTEDGVFDTNALGGGGGQTKPLTAKRAILWNEDDIATNPLTVDITKIFVTNSSVDTTATFKASFLLSQ